MKSTETFWLGRLPPRQNPFPQRIDVFAHLGFVVAFAVRAFLVTFTAARDLIVVEFHAKAGFVRNCDLSVDNWNASSEHDFVLRLRPWIMRVACIAKVR